MLPSRVSRLSRRVAALVGAALYASVVIGCASDPAGEAIGCTPACAASEACDATTSTCVAAAECAVGLTRCRTACVDLAIDRAHCGDCDNDCGARGCRGGECVDECAAGTVSCAGACADPQSDARHCGGCGKACAPTESCLGGRCGCATGSVTCSGACVNPAGDALHCGGCGKACDDGKVCLAGACVCSGPGLLTCGLVFKRCVDSMAAPGDCGRCGQRCDDDQYCDRGACACRPGLVVVRDRCVDPTSDSDHCGKNLVACGGSTPVCVNGACATAADCKGPRRFCKDDDVCADIARDPLHCGTSCGDLNDCAQDEICVQGECRGYDVSAACNACPCGGLCAGKACCVYPGGTRAICVDGKACP